MLQNVFQLTINREVQASNKTQIKMSKPIPGEWAPIFRKYAAEQRYTQAEISRQTGIPLQTINAYFQGLRSPRKENFDKITNLLKITL